ncbi:hypothetical protein PF006_g20351 [Phytophthora fragariae]|uniref:Uncharacterized protein n=1 Tax=Phytophthora fragariae TaxID=53985 RepID=A0A6A3S8L2_9STRA|nr:hypothetical protein PF006_g20351 [Phytophthora fragariae]
MTIVSKVIDGEPYTKPTPASWPATDRTEDEDPLGLDPSTTASVAFSRSTADLDWSEATVDAGRTGRPSRRGGITTAVSNGEFRTEAAAPGAAGGGPDGDGDAAEASGRRGEGGGVHPAVDDGTVTADRALGGGATGADWLLASPWDSAATPDDTPA